jgi:hypothetical protein
LWWGIDDENNSDHDTVRNPGLKHGNGIAALDTDELVLIIRPGVGAGPLLKKVRSLNSNHGDKNSVNKKKLEERPQGGYTDVVIESIERAVSYPMHHPTTHEVGVLQRSCT